MALEDAVLALAGLSLGDAFGQSFYMPPTGGMIERRELPPAPWSWSDDTQLAISVYEELRDREWIDQDYLARRMALHFSSDPDRGFGNVTRQVLESVAQGEYFRSALYRRFAEGSYGAAAASRAVIAGAFFAAAPAHAAREACLAAGVTHTHPEALAAAEAVAQAAALAARPHHPTGADFLDHIGRTLPTSEIRRRIEAAASIPAHRLDQALNLSGPRRAHTVLNTVPFALWCAAHNLHDYTEALWTAIASPGLRDTIGAIVGGIVALAVRRLPEDWLARREALPTGIADLNQPSAPSPQSAAPQKPGAIRVDPLTGLPNLFAFLEWAAQVNETGKLAEPFTALAIHLTAIQEMNRAQGRAAGDELLRSFAADLRAYAGSPVYRTGGDRFIVLFQAGDRAQAAARAARLVDRLSPRIPTPAHTALVHFAEAAEVSPGQVLICLNYALLERHYAGGGHPMREFDAADIRAAHEDYPWMAADLAAQYLNMGRLAEEAMRLSETDVISQLPNMRAALRRLESALHTARSTRQPLAVLMIDGDNLRCFNREGYEAGDEAIRLMAAVLQLNLRTSDFLARWRTGDEFLILLPGSEVNSAHRLADRLRRAVHEDSAAWRHRTSISIGLAAYPDHGKTVQDLLSAVEKALEDAKRRGKNQVAVAAGQPYPLG